MLKNLEANDTYFHNLAYHTNNRLINTNIQHYLTRLLTSQLIKLILFLQLLIKNSSGYVYSACFGLLSDLGFERSQVASLFVRNRRKSRDPSLSLNNRRDSQLSQV